MSSCKMKGGNGWGHGSNKRYHNHNKQSPARRRANHQSVLRKKRTALKRAQDEYLAADEKLRRYLTYEQ